MKADFRKKLAENAEKESENKLDTDINEKLLANLDGEIPEVMFEHRVDDMVRDWEYRNRYQGIKLDDYLKYAGITIEQFKENFRAPAIKQVTLRLILEKIAELESITVSEEEIEKSYAELAEEHKMEVEKVKAVIASDNLAEDLKVEKAFKFVKENAEITVE